MDSPERNLISSAALCLAQYKGHQLRRKVFPFEVPLKYPKIDIHDLQANAFIPCGRRYWNCRHIPQIKLRHPYPTWKYMTFALSIYSGEPFLRSVELCLPINNYPRRLNIGITQPTCNGVHHRLKADKVW